MINAGKISLGLDAEGQEIITQRYTTIYGFLHHNLLGDREDHNVYRQGADLFLQRQFIELEHSIIYSHVDGRTRWRDTYLLPLAKELDLFTSLEEKFVQRCWRRGWFDYYRPMQRRLILIRPALEEVAPRVHATCTEHPFAKHQIGALMNQGVCRDERTARAVTDELKRKGNVAASLARGLILAYLEYGLVGLLTYSSYPYVDELLLLERQAKHVAQLIDHPQRILAALRRDICALKWTLQSIELTATQNASGEHKLWNQSLLHAPPRDEVRQRYIQYVTDDIRAHIIHVLVQQRGCSTEEAAHLFELFVTNGLTGLIDWRCAMSPTSSQTSLVAHQIQNALDTTLGALVPEARTEIADLLRCLQRAVDQTQASFAIVPLLTTYSPHIRRQRRSRQVWFSAAAGARRQQSRKKRRSSIIQPQRKISLGHIDEPMREIATEDQLVATFAAYAGLDESDARHRLRDLITYGGIGMLRKGDRLTALDARLVTYLHCMKLGHVDGTLNWSHLLRHINTYASLLNIPALSPQLAKALFNSLPKPRRWHGGEGTAVAAIRQRATLILTNAPRLHTAWKIVIVPLRLPLFDHGYRPVCTTCHVLLILDRDSGLPVGCWVCEHPPQSADIGLALYQAIWHPGMPHWPLKGVPEVVEIPAALAHDNLADLRSALAFLLAQIDITPKQPSRLSVQAEDFLLKVRMQGPTQVHTIAGTPYVTRQQAQNALLTWLRALCFPNHRSAEVPPQVSKVGMGMPGYDTPAAGWLLPLAGHVTAVRDGIRDRGLLYASPWFRSEPGTTFRKREFPDVYPNMEQAMFVEQLDGQSQHLWYLVRSDSPEERRP